MTSMPTRNSMDTGALESLFDRAAHLTEDMIVGFYLPASNKAQDALTKIGSISKLATSVFALGAVYAIPTGSFPAFPELAPGVSALMTGLSLYGTGVAGMITYACFGERGRNARVDIPSPR